MRKYVWGLWSVCGCIVEKVVGYGGIKHSVWVGVSQAGYSLGIFTWFYTHLHYTHIHSLRACFFSIKGCLSSFSTTLIITTTWYKHNIFINSVCGKAAI